MGWRRRAKKAKTGPGLANLHAEADQLVRQMVTANLAATRACAEMLLAAVNADDANRVPTMSDAAALAVITQQAEAALAEATLAETLFEQALASLGATVRSIQEAQREADAMLSRRGAE